MKPSMLAVFAAAALGLAAPAGAAPATKFTLIDNRVFIPVALEGHGAYAFILDTGAPGFSISTPVMRSIGARAEGSETGSGAGEGTETAFQTHVGDLAIGAAHWRHAAVDAQSFQALNDVIGFTRFDGVAGKPVFDRFVADIDFRTSEIHFADPARFAVPPGALVLPFEFYQGFLPIVPGSIGGVRGKFLVDLGDRSALTLFGPFWRAHRLDTAFGKTVTALTGYGIGGPIRSLVARAPAFAFGPAHAAGVIVRLSLQKTGGFADPNLAGSIGTALLKRFHVFIDYPHRRFVLVPLTDAPDAYDRTGLWLGRHGTEFEIYDVVPGTPGAAAGLRAGDIVTAIDAVPVAKLDLFAVRARWRDPATTAAITLVYRRGGKAGEARLRPAEILPHT
ncbi:MAG TPA: aspartyl protease family protein [Rhizomicrobium sp.]|jgi:hypothetical protein|nr:aspartyl protease family protein [Rhizomicrobium sp.]